MSLSVVAAKFDTREWVNEIATGTLTGFAAGAFGALLLPDGLVGRVALGTGAAGFMRGLLAMPIKWLLNRRPAEDPGE